MSEEKELIKKFQIIHREYNEVRFAKPSQISDGEWAAIALAAEEHFEKRKKERKEFLHNRAIGQCS